MLAEHFGTVTDNVGPVHAYHLFEGRVDINNSAIHFGDEYSLCPLLDCGAQPLLVLGEPGSGDGARYLLGHAQGQVHCLIGKDAGRLATQNQGADLAVQEEQGY